MFSARDKKRKREKWLRLSNVLICFFLTCALLSFLGHRAVERPLRKQATFWFASGQYLSIPIRVKGQNRCVRALWFHDQAFWALVVSSITPSINPNISVSFYKFFVFRYVDDYCGAFVVYLRSLICIITLPSRKKSFLQPNTITFLYVELIHSSYPCIKIIVFKN